MNTNTQLSTLVVNLAQMCGGVATLAAQLATELANNPISTDAGEALAAAGASETDDTIKPKRTRKPRAKKGDADAGSLAAATTDAVLGVDAGTASAGTASTPAPAAPVATPTPQPAAATERAPATANQADLAREFLTFARGIGGREGATALLGEFGVAKVLKVPAERGDEFLKRVAEETERLTLEAEFI